MNRASGTPLAQQIVRTICDMMASGALLRGSVLPSTRALASELGVSRNTVMVAYEELAALGVVRASRGSCTRVIVGPGTVRQRTPLEDFVSGSRLPLRVANFTDVDGLPVYCYEPAGAHC